MDNLKALKDRGIYEEALVHAYSATRTIHQARSEIQLPDTDILVSGPGVEPHRLDLEPSP